MDIDLPSSNSVPPPLPRVIFLNRYFYPDFSATSQLLTDLAFHLTRRGVDVLVMTSRQKYDEPKSALPSRETVDGVRVRRLWSTRFGRTSLPGRFFDYASFCASAFIALLREPLDQAIVIAKTDPPLISFIAAMAIQLRGGTLVNWIQDLFPEVAEELGVIRRRGVLANLARSARNHALRTASANVVPGELLEQRLKSSGARVDVISNWADGENIRPLDPIHNSLRREWGLQNALVVAHSGNLGRAHDHKTILGAMRRLASSPQVQFLFIGGGAGYETLRQETSLLALQNVQFRPYQPRETLRESLGVADIHLVSLHPQLEGLIVPSKFYGIAAAGRPTVYIGSEDGEIGRLIMRAQCGIVVPAGHDADLVRAIERLANLETRSAMSRAARQLFDEAFDAKLALNAWTKLLESLSPSAALSRS